MTKTGTLADEIASVLSVESDRGDVLALPLSVEGWEEIVAALRTRAAPSSPGELGGNEILRLLDARIAEQWMNGYDNRPQHPTNWQPLPAPPSLTGEQGGAK